MILAVLGFGHGAHAQTRVALSLYLLDEGKLVGFLSVRTVLRSLFEA